MSNIFNYRYKFQFQILPYNKIYTKYLRFYFTFKIYEIFIIILSIIINKRILYTLEKHYD